MSNVVFGTNPAPVMAPCAAVADWPTRPGTETQLPLDTTMLTGVFGWHVLPPAGVLLGDEPVWNWLEQALVCVPTVRPAWFNCEPADAGDCPSTLGTGTWLCVPDTVSTTATFCLTLAPAGRRLRNDRPDRLGTGDVLDRVIQALGG